MVTNLLLLGTGVVAGAFGALMGLGGGIIMIPILTLFFHVPMHNAIAASVVAVIATSSATAIHYVAERLSNIKLGMTLEVATTAGAIIGGLLAAHSPDRVLRLVFALFLVYTAASMLRSKRGRGKTAQASAGEAAASHSQRLDAGPWDDRYHDPSIGAEVAYSVRNIPFGMGISFFAGNLSGLLGIGGGLIKVPAMNMVMGVPFKAAAATSNFMIGVTAVASAFIYYGEGLVNPMITAPVALGVFFGASLGARFAPRLSSKLLVQGFSVVLVAQALIMSAQALGLSGR